MSAPDIDYLLDLWALSMAKHNDTGPFESVTKMYEAIDATKVGDAPWKCLVVRYNGPVDEDSPEWMKAQYEVWFRNTDTVASNILKNPDFNGQFDYTPYVEVRRKTGRRWSNLMSGNAAWLHSVS